jgi:hypothetical protein
MVPNQHKKIIKQMASNPTLTESIDQQIKTVKKWPEVQTTPPIQQLPAESISSFQVGGRERVLQELQTLKKSEGLKEDFKQKLNKLMGGQ